MIGNTALTVSPPTLPNGTVGTAYSQTLTATGSAGPFTYSVISGSLPTGLALSSGGVLSGTPSAAGTQTFTVQAMDLSFNAGTRTYSLTIIPTPLAINPPSLPVGTVGTAYSQTVTASGGTGPYTFAVTSARCRPGSRLTQAAAPSAARRPPRAPSASPSRRTDSTANTGSRNYTVISAPIR